MVPKTQRFWPEMKTRRGCGASWPCDPPVDVDPFDLATGEALGVLGGSAQGVAVVGIARQGGGVQHQPAAR